MADASLFPRSGLEHLLGPRIHGAQSGEPGVTLAARPDLALAYVLVRNGKGDALQQRVRERFGLALPMTAQAAEHDKIPILDGLSFIWAGPGRWLARRPGENGTTFEETLRAELSAVASVINQTDGRCVFQIGGPRVREALAKGFPIDLDARVFGPGDTALTVVGHVNVHLWQIDRAPTYEIAVARSFAASFCEWLFAAAASYGLLISAK